MQIGAVAKKMGLRVDAIRFYEHSSLLPRPPRTSEPTTSTAMSAAMTARSVRLVDVGPAHPVMPPNCPPVMCSTCP